MHRGIRRHSGRLGDRSEFSRTKLAGKSESAGGAQVESLASEIQALRQDLAEAAHLQHLLNAPRQLWRGAFHIGCETFPVHLISGDFCTMFDVGDRTVIALGDIAGKGLTAGMWFTHIVSLVRCHAGATEDPAMAMHAINNELCSLQLQRPLITVFLASLDWKANTITYCRAGHPPPVIVRKNSGPELAYEGGPVLGVVRDASFDTGTFSPQSGEGLLAYSDGLSELCNVEGQEFGIAGLLDAVESCDRTSADQFVFCMLGAGKDFAGGCEPRDDITLMAVLRD